MAVKFNVTEAKFNATIELTDITEEVYRDIVTYVSMRTAVEAERKEEAPEAKPAAPMAANDIPKVTESTEKGHRYRGSHPHLAKALDEYFKKAKDDPKHYEEVVMNSHDFANRFPEYSEYPMRGIGRKLSEHCKSAGSVFGKSPNGSPMQIKRWYVPILKKANPLGETIKKGREESGLSVKELAELIEYPADVVKKWESGEYTPSCDGLSAMKLVLGEKLFEDLK